MPATRTTLGITSLVLVFAGALDARAGAPPLTNTIEMVGSFPRNARMYKVRIAINDRGDVGGEFEGVNTPDMIWHRAADGVETRLDVGGHKHRFGGINENGEMVYTTWKEHGGPNAPGALHLFRPGIGLQTLVESAEVPVNVFGYNNSGQTAGHRANSAGSGMQAVRFEPGAGFVDLGGPPGSSYRAGRAINASGQVAAEYSGSNPNFGYAAVHTPGVGWRTLGSLGGGWTWVEGINDHGVVVGGSRSPSGQIQPFIAAPGQPMRALGLFSGHSLGWAYAINNHGWVIGESGYETCFLWTEQTGLIDLETLLPPNSGWEIEDVFDINNHGQVAGKGRMSGINYSFPFVLTIRTLEPSNPADAPSAPPMGAGALRAVLTNFGQAGVGLAGDVNADGAIDAMDLRAVVERVGAGR